MEWLSQNWLGVFIGIGLLLVMRRGGMCCGTHGGHQRGSTPDKPPADPDGKPVGVPDDQR